MIIGEVPEIDLVCEYEVSQSCWGVVYLRDHRVLCENHWDIARSVKSTMLCESSSDLTIPDDCDGNVLPRWGGKWLCQHHWVEYIRPLVLSEPRAPLEDSPFSIFNDSDTPELRFTYANMQKLRPDVTVSQQVPPYMLPEPGISEDTKWITFNDFERNNDARIKNESAKIFWKWKNPVYDNVELEQPKEKENQKDGECYIDGSGRGLLYHPLEDRSIIEISKSYPKEKESK